MRTIALRVAASSCLLASFMACPPPVVECIDGTEAVCEDAGALPPDFCNSAEEAQSDTPNCHITVTTGGPANRLPKDGVYVSRLTDGGVDQDWYYAVAPAGLTPRSLLHVSGGYTAPQSAVNFQVNVLERGSDGSLLSVITAIDKHGPAAPRPIDVIKTFSNSSAELFFLVNDEGVSGQVRVDNRNPYSFFAEIVENPDVNEPNDMTPTAITLAGTPATGTSTGFLATDDDVDLFSFPMSAAGRQIIYLHILGPDPHPMNPPPPFKLSYTLFDPADRPIAEGTMANEFLRIDLATARLAPMTGTYKVKVNGFKPPTTTLPIKGDLRIEYSVAITILPDLDVQEGTGGNDSEATAKVLNLPPNTRLPLQGKLSYVADEEWFLASLPAHATPSTLRYQLTVATGGGRFAPLTGTPARQIRVLKRVTTGPTAQDRQNACLMNATACPRAADAQPMLVDALCRVSDPPQCLYAQRNEEIPRIPNVRNLVGAIPVELNQAQEFLIMFRDEGLGASKYADDRDWTLDLQWVDDADEASRVGGPTMMGLSGTPSVATGEISFGYGRVLGDIDDYFRSSDGLRGINDYDAFETDKDLFQFNLGGATGDQSWELSWELFHPDGGTRPPGDLGFEFTFCGGGAAPDGGLCGASQNRLFAYNDQSLTPWYLPQSVSNGRMLFTRMNTPTATTITVAPVTCMCLSAARTTPGVFFANIAGINRTANDPIRYRISQRIAAYPASFTSPDGGSGMCPVADAGCQFAR